MSDCRNGGRLTYLPPEDEREPGVLYQHPLYSLKFYEQLTAIEVRGVRFERARECEFVMKPDDMGRPYLKCGHCGAYICDGRSAPDRWKFCPTCGAKVVVA